MCHSLTLCLLLNFTIFFRLLIFSNFLKKYFRSTTRLSNSLDQCQALHFVWPGLGPNCLQKLSADNRSRQKSKTLFVSLLLGLYVKYFGGFLISFHISNLLPAKTLVSLGSCLPMGADSQELFAGQIWHQYHFLLTFLIFKTHLLV